MIIEVYRGAGEKVGAPITEPMLSDAMLKVRGTEEMNSHAHMTNQLMLDIVPRAGVRLGHLVSSIDLTSAQTIVSKVTGIAINITEQGTTMSVTVEQPV